MWVFSIISGQCYGYPLVPYRATTIPWDLCCCFEVLSFAAYPGYPLVPYRHTNIPCYLGCCFEVLSFAAYPGYPLVPYRDTIHCDLACCFEVISLAAYPGYPLVPYPVTNILGICVDVSKVLPFSTRDVPAWIMPAPQAARINFGTLDGKSNKMTWCYCLKVALNYAINLHTKRLCMLT